MSEHTKVEWKSSKPHKISNRKFKSIMAVGESVLAFVFGNSKKETEANAHLISAAPEMYEELKASSNRLMAIVLSGYITDESTKSNVNKQIDYNNKALLKAEGKP